MHMASYLVRVYFAPKRAVLWMVFTSSSFGAASISVARGGGGSFRKIIFIEENDREGQV